MAKVKCSVEGCKSYPGQYTDDGTCEKHNAINLIKRFAPPGSTIYGIVTHVSRSGMQRRIKLYSIGDDRRPIFLSGYAARAIGWRFHDRDGAVIVDGCGMNMIFHLVDTLRAVVFGREPIAGFENHVGGRNPVWHQEQL